MPVRLYEKTALTKTDTSLNRHEILVNNRVEDVKKDYGIFFTPERIVDFMVSLIDGKNLTNKKNVSILEPACGLAQFLMGVKRNKPGLFKKAERFGVEVNRDIVGYLDTLQTNNEIKLSHTDYLLWQPNLKFDVVIGNPPYGIPSLSSHYSIKVDKKTKQKYKNLYETWYGKYNVYGAFIEKSIKLLKERGQLIFITPATFMILDEFKKLRKFLARNGKTQIIYMGPEVFKPEADTTTAVLNFKKIAKNPPALELSEYKNSKVYPVKKIANWQGGIVTLETEYTGRLRDLCSHSLGDIYNIRISPRTPEIKVKYRSYIKSRKPREGGYLPILNGRNLKCSEITYEDLTGYWIKKANIKKLRSFFSEPHPVVGLGFRGNGNVAAAYDERGYPWMGDVYHLLRGDTLFTDGFDLNDLEVVEYLNSNYVKRYIKDAFREITYHLSITQLKSVPIPTKEGLEHLKQIYG